MVLRDKTQALRLYINHNVAAVRLLHPPSLRIDLRSCLAGILEKKERDAIARTWQGKGFP